jgi:hypothetical protein
MSLGSLKCAVMLSEVFGGRGGYGQLGGPILAYLSKIFTSSTLLTCFPFDSKRLPAPGNATKHADSAICRTVDDALVTFVEVCVASLRIRCCVLLSIRRGNLACNWHPQYAGSDQLLDSVLDVFLRGSDIWAVDLQLLYRMRVAVHSTEFQQRVIGDVLKSRVRKQWVVQEVMQDDAQRLQTTASQKQSQLFAGCSNSVVVER